MMSRRSVASTPLSPDDLPDLPDIGEHSEDSSDSVRAAAVTSEYLTFSSLRADSETFRIKGYRQH